ncbi:hypothetical protein BgiMline_035699 [Biomphalaria glabrata]|nr:hypothetical protein BgiMline_031000 [Biomphalaria glabrata]
MMSSEHFTSSPVASETPRVDKRQPIIIQNVDHVVSGRTRCKRKALAVANLYLSAVMLSRQGVSQKGAKEHPHSKVDEKLHDVAETDPGRYRGFGPSSSLAGASPDLSPLQPAEKVKLKKQVTFIEGPLDPDISNTKSAFSKTQPRSIFSYWNEQVPRSKEDADFARLRSADGKGSSPSLNLSSARKEQSEFFSPARDLCWSEDLNSSRHSLSDVKTSKDYVAARSLDTSQRKYNSINDFRGRSTAAHRIHFGALSGNEPDDISLRGNGYPSSIDIDFNTHKTPSDNENKEASETNLSSNQNKRSEIESALQLNRNESLPSHSPDNKRSEVTSENTILLIDTSVKTLKKMHLDPDTNNTRNVIKVHFLKDKTLSIPRVQSSSYRQNVVSTNDNPVNDDTLFLQNSPADNALANSELNSLVKENTKFLMQKYSFLGERKPKQEPHLASFDQHSEGHLQLKPPDCGNKEAEPSAEVNIPQRTREKSGRKQATNSPEYELLTHRARSCSAVERRSQTSCGFYRSNDRFFVLTHPSTLTRTARNRLLEEFVMDSTRSRHQLAVQKRLKSACQST